MSIDPRAFRDALGCFATGICVAATLDAEGAPVGVTVNSVTSVSLNPPLLLFCLDRNAECHAAFMASDSFALTVLATDQRAMSDNFARPPGPGRWDGVVWRAGITGSPMLDAGLAFLDCRRHAVHDGGDHTILVGRVLGIAHRPEGDPLLYFRGAYRAIGPAP